LTYQYQLRTSRYLVLAALSTKRMSFTSMNYALHPHMCSSVYYSTCN